MNPHSPVLTPGHATVWSPSTVTLSPASQFWVGFAEGMRGEPFSERPSPGLAQQEANGTSISQPSLHGLASSWQRAASIAPPAFELPNPAGHFALLAKWQGRVIDVTAQSFAAVLVDQLQDVPEEEADFPMEEVSEDDRPLVTDGALFYWVIGYWTNASRRVSRESIIRFQRLPRWSAEEVERHEEWADSLRLNVQSG